MSTLISNLQTDGFLGNYVSDVGVTLVFGLGYYAIKALANKIDLNSSSSQYIDTTQKNKLEGSFCPKSKSPQTIDEYHQLINGNDNTITIDPFSFINQMVKSGVIPTIDTYNALMSYSYEKEDFETAEMLKEEVLDVMGQVSPNVSTLTILIKGLSLKYKDLLEHSGTSNREVLYGTFDRELLDLISSFEKREIYLDETAQSTILTGLVDMGRILDAWNQLQSMKRHFTPGISTYLKLMQGIIKESKNLHHNWLESAFLLMAECKMYFPGDISGYKCMMEICVKFEACDRVESLFNEIQETADEPTYIIMIQAYACSQKLDQVLEMFNKLKQAHGMLTQGTYTAVISASIMCKDIARAQSLLSEMTLNGIPANSEIYASFINGYRILKNFSQAIELYEKLTSKNEIELELDLSFFNAILLCCVDLNKYDKMNEIFTYMKTLDYVTPNFETYTIIIKGYAKGNQIAKVTEIYSYLRTRSQFQIEETLYNTILDSYARHNDEMNAMLVFKDMKSREVKPSVITYGVMIKLFSKIGNSSKAFEMLDECLQNGITPTVVIYQILIKMQVKSKLIEAADSLFKQMIENGIKADAMICELMINACIDQNREKEAGGYIIYSLRENIKIEKYLVEKLADKLSMSDIDKATINEIASEVLNIVISTNFTKDKKLIDKYTRMCSNKQSQPKKKDKNTIKNQDFTQQQPTNSSTAGQTKSKSITHHGTRK